MIVEINGNPLAVEVLGPEGAPLIIAHHGGPGVSSRAEPKASFGRLADTYRVLVFDARGSGESGENGPLTHEQWAADVDALREWAGAEKIVMAGGSYGGFISLEYATRYPDRLLAVVLRDTAADNAIGAMAKANALASTRVSVDPEKLDRIFAGQIRDAEDLVACNSEIMPLYDYVLDWGKIEKKLEFSSPHYNYKTHNAAFSTQMPNYDLKDKLPSIAVPTLVTVGRADWIAPVAASETIAGLIPGAELKIFEESGHSPQIEQVEEWTAAVRDFLTRHVPA